ncbi:extracellular solute-binding protein [Kamptonema cortianum]|nr:extracellular solute-binding protein [Kamptonema cortianum]
MNLSKLVLALAVVGSISLAGCGPNKPSGDAPKEESKDISVMVFEGGYGKDFYEKAAEEFNSETGKNVSVIGDPRIDQQVMPLFQKGTPPDLTYPGWRFDHWKSVEDGAIMDITEAMKGKAWKSEETWADTFEPNLLALGQKDGKQYVLPYFFSVTGWWYDPDLFAEKGWTVPKNYAELLALCQKIKAAGIAPITYQGQYPDYMIFGMLQPWIISAGGNDAFTAIQNLEPGAWQTAGPLKAAQMIRELRDMGYFQQGATAMSHTEAQAEFINRRAAFVPCGTWLYSEMKQANKENRRMEFMLPPVLGDGKGDPTSLMIKIEPWMVPSAAKSPKGAIEFYKYMTSLEKAKQFVEEKGTLMAIKGSDEANMPEYLQGAAKAFKASKTVWASQWKEWYPTLYKAVENNITLLVNGELTPEEFCKRCEAEAEKVRQDPNIPKRKV